MNSICDTAIRNSRQIALKISALATLILAVGILALKIWNCYYRVDSSVAAVSNQVAHLLKVGDSFALKSQLLSLSAQGLVSHFVLTEPSGIVVAGDGEKEGHDSVLQGASDYGIRNIDGKMNFIRKFRILVSHDQSATLTVASELHPELLLFLALIPISLFIVLRFALQKYMLRFVRDLTGPMTDLTTAVTSAVSYECLANDPALRDRLKYTELNQSYDSFVHLLAKLNREEKLRIAAEKDATLSQVAAQVAHDIRSPLAALDVLLTKSQKGFPELEGQILRAATQRIGDIANNLLTKSRMSTEATRGMETQVIMVASLVEAVVSEKRVQFRHLRAIEIEADLEEAYGQFIAVNPTELARSLSNLVNNAVEALPNSAGRVTVQVVGRELGVHLSVRDNGCGIAGELLGRLGCERVSVGKSNTESGSGLGLLHAKKMVSEAGGQMSIESALGEGTEVILQFPSAPAPAWFLERLVLKPNQLVVTVDDMDAIHQVWSERLKTGGSRNSEITQLSFCSLSEFVQWVSLERPANVTYLVDYEFVGEQANGLETILQLGIQDQAVLVSSRCEELQAKMTDSGVKLLPKSAVKFVPVSVARSSDLSVVRTAGL